MASIVLTVAASFGSGVVYALWPIRPAASTKPAAPAQPAAGKRLDATKLACGDAACCWQHARMDVHLVPTFKLPAAPQRCHAMCRSGRQCSRMIWCGSDDTCMQHAMMKDVRRVPHARDPQRCCVMRTTADNPGQCKRVATRDQNDANKA